MPPKHAWLSDVSLALENACINLCPIRRLAGCYKTEGKICLLTVTFGSLVVPGSHASYSDAASGINFLSPTMLEEPEDVKNGAGTTQVILRSVIVTLIMISQCTMSR